MCLKSEACNFKNASVDQPAAIPGFNAPEPPCEVCGGEGVLYARYPGTSIRASQWTCPACNPQDDHPECWHDLKG